MENHTHINVESEDFFLKEITSSLDDTIIGEKGLWNAIEIRNEIVITDINLKLKEPIEVENKYPVPLVLFCFMRQGNISATNNGKEIAKIAPGQCAIMTIPAGVTNYIYSDLEVENNLTLFVFSRPSFYNYASSYVSRFPKEVQDALMDKETAFIHKCKMDPPTKHTLSQLIERDYNNLSHQFHIEHEMFSCFMFILNDIAMNIEKEKEKSTEGLHDERMGEIYQILKNKYANPPSLMELAATFGINVTHIISAFHKSYGITPYQFVKERKLKEAKKLLAKSNISISEVAYDVGYSTPGSFTRAYKKYFGTSPSEIF